MSDGMSEYWKNKKIRDQEMKDESIARQARDAVARVIQRPDLVRKNPIFIMNGTVIQKFKEDSYKEILDLTGIETLGQLEVEEVPMSASAVRYSKKE